MFMVAFLLGRSARPGGTERPDRKRCQCFSVSVWMVVLFSIIGAAAGATVVVVTTTRRETSSLPRQDRG